MFTLPKLLYFYRELPITIPDTFFNSIKGILRTYIWSSTRPRCPHSVTTKLKKAGGMGLPEVKDYYIAVLLDQSRHWFTPRMGKQQEHIEQTFISKGDLGSLLLTSGLPNVNYKKKHPTITVTLRA